MGKSIGLYGKQALMGIDDSCMRTTLSGAGVTCTQFNDVICL